MKAVLTCLVGMCPLFQAMGGSVRRFWGDDFSVEVTAFSPDGGKLAYGSQEAPRPLEFQNGLIQIWDFSSGLLLKTLSQEPNLASGKRGAIDGKVISLNFSADGKYLVGGDAVGYTLWDVASGEAMARFQSDAGASGWGWVPAAGGQKWTVAFPAGRSVDGALVEPPGWELWKMTALDRSVNRLRLGRMSDGESPVETLAMSSAGRLVATTSGRAIQVWQASGMRRIYQARLAHPIQAIEFSPVNPLVLMATENGMVHEFEFAADDQLTRHTEVGEVLAGEVVSMRLSHDGSRMAIGGTKSTGVWRLRPLQKVGEIAGTHPAFSHDGTWIAVVTRPEESAGKPRVEVVARKVEELR